MKYNRGFTLIELLVVIAIIGILSTVVLTSLGSARTKARIAAAQATMSSVVPVLVTCLDANTADITAPAASGDVCGANDGAAVFPALPTNWAYGCASPAAQ